MDTTRNSAAVGTNPSGLSRTPKATRKPANSSTVPGRMSFDSVSVVTRGRRSVRRVTSPAIITMTRVVAMGIAPGLDNASKPEMPTTL